MKIRWTPYFKVEEASAPSSESWGDLARQLVNDDQPETESDTEALEEEQTDSEDVVKPDAEIESNEESTEETSEQPEDGELLLDDDTEVDLGEGRQPIKFRELKDGYLRQSDYTKKTQELATQRKEVESQLEQVKPAQEWLTYMNQNPWLFNQFHQAIQQWNQTGVLPLEDVMQDAESAKYLNHFMAENNALKKENDDLKARLGDVEFSSTMNGVISELKAEYGELITPEYEASLRDQAKEQNLPAELIKKIAKGDLAEQKLQQVKTNTKKAKKEAEAKTIQSLQEKRMPPQPKNNAQRPSNQPPDISGMSWGELARYHAGG
jgi:regulator of replication initiation timing